VVSDRWFGGDRNRCRGALTIFTLISSLLPLLPLPTYPRLVAVGIVVLGEEMLIVKLIYVIYGRAEWDQESGWDDRQGLHHLLQPQTLIWVPSSIIHSLSFVCFL